VPLLTLGLFCTEEFFAELELSSAESSSRDYLDLISSFCTLELWPEEVGSAPDPLEAYLAEI